MPIEYPVIHSIGTAVPNFKISQLEHSEVLAKSEGLSPVEMKLLKRVYNRSGIEYRYSVLEEFGRDYASDNTLFHSDPTTQPAKISRRMELFNQFAPELALAASNDCLQHFPESAVDKITHVITFSCTGMSAPGLDLQLAGLLGLPSNIERTCINFMGCYAAVNALKSAWHIARSAPEAVILIAGVELCTLHYQRHKDAEHLVSNALFGDGAAAAIISSGNFSSHKLYEMNSFHAEFFPEGDATMVWKINEDGFDLKLDAYVPALIEKGIPGMTENAFAKMNISKDAIRHFALHPGGVRILEACERALNLTKADTSISHSILNDFGNMSSVTILFVLKALAQKARRNEKVFACAFGPGLTMESLILTTN